MVSSQRNKHKLSRRPIFKDDYMTTSLAFRAILLFLGLILCMQLALVFFFDAFVPMQDGHDRKNSTAKKSRVKSVRLDDIPPPLPPFAPIPDVEKHIEQTLKGNPSMNGIMGIIEGFLLDLHDTFKEMKNKRAERDEIVVKYVELAKKHLIPFDKIYRGKNIFPVREDESIFISLAAFREHLLGKTLEQLFSMAQNPDKIYVGVVVQNCWGTDYTCKTGAQVVGKDKFGRDQTKVSDAPPDANGVDEFCSNSTFQHYCTSGHVRALYVNETESLGPAVARYHASKLWMGETFYLQVDSHLKFAQNWDQLYIDEVKLTKFYPKSILSAYPPGFDGYKTNVRPSPGARLCNCEFSQSDVEHSIIRINAGGVTPSSATKPTQIPFMAAGFFFARSEFLRDVPFDPLLPWTFMGEEIVLSMRSWTSGWKMYAPRKNLIAHQYRPGRMGLPKFWGSVSRTFGRQGPGFNTQLGSKVIHRIKHLIGYPESSRELVKAQGDLGVLDEYKYYALGNESTREQYMEFANIDIANHECSPIGWCHKSSLE
mmetsp:Transcript_16691/g.23658  ORF Transcript_16691/g.23658 Transcript_16691/m.23658 type:complete len:540 (+) Transcript_16691:52-1671(+)